MAGADLTLTEADHGKTVKARVGERLVLRLHEIPSSGYRWDEEAIDAGLIDAQHAGTEEGEGEHPEPSKPIGGGRSAVWILTTKAAGVTDIKLKLWRPWEGEKSIQRRFRVTLRVEA